MCRTLLQSPTVPASSRRKPWFERSLCAVRIRIVCGGRLLFAGGKTDYTEQTDNCPWQLSAGISNKLQIRNNVTKCPTPSPTGDLFIRCVTVLFAPTIASLREVAKRREGSVEPERDRAAARRWTAIAGEGESGINGYRSLYSERCPLFCGRGGETSDIFCAALSLSHLRCQLSPGESLGLSVLFVRCVTARFAHIL